VDRQRRRARGGVVELKVAAPIAIHIERTVELAVYQVGTAVAWYRVSYRESSSGLSKRVGVLRARLIPLHEMGVQPAGDEIRITKDLEV
jgi:hypothetical protein